MPRFEFEASKCTNYEILNKNSRESVLVIFGKPKLKSQDQRVSSKTFRMKLGCRHPCPLIYLKVVSELLALIFFAAASGVCFTLYLTAKKLQNEFEGVFDRQRDVLMSASIIYAILFILSFLATSYTVHLLSDYFEKDDHYFKQLWKLLGQDKIKTPLPSPHDEEPKQDDENKGQLISECLFDFFKFSKKPTKNLTNFCRGI